MPLETKVLLKELGMPEELAEKEITDFWSEFNGAFISKATASSDEEFVNKLTGKRVGPIMTALMREFELDKKEFGDKTPEYIATHVSKTYKQKLKELTDAGGGSNDENAKKLQANLEKLTGELNQYKEQNQTLSKQIEEQTQSYEGKLKSISVKTHLDKVKAEIPFVSDDESPLVKLAKDGFDTHIEKTYNFDVDDQGNLVVTDKSGNKIHNKNKTAFLSPLEVLKRDAEEKKILRLNNGQPKNSGGKKDDTDIQPVHNRTLPKKAIANADR